MSTTIPNTGQGPIEDTALAVVNEAGTATVVEAAVQGRRRGVPVPPPMEMWRAVLRHEARRVPTHRKEVRRG